MNVTCLALELDGGVRPEAEPTAVSRWRAGDGAYWIHLNGCAPAAVTAWLSGLEMDPELLGRLPIGEGQPRILPLGEFVFIVFPIPADEKATRSAHLDILCLDRLVITIQDRPEESSMLDGVPVTKLKLPEATTAGVVCALTLVHATRLRRSAASLRREADALDTRMDADPQAVSLEEVLALKRRVQALGEVVVEDLAIFDVLKISNRPALPLIRLAETFETVVEMMRAADRDVDRLDRHVSDTQRRFESAQQDQTNRRLGLLTVLSTIFMPATLIAAIYGMNFDFMPELHYRYAYPAALLGMVLIAGGLYWMVRSRWLLNEKRDGDR